MLINQPVGVGGIKKVRGGVDEADPIANDVKFVKAETLNEF